jgi:hypothetical protein
MRRSPRRYKRTGRPVMDSILSRVEDIGWILADLDEEARTKLYFRKQTWRRRKLNYKAIGLAVKALEGELTIRWVWLHFIVL